MKITDAGHCYIVEALDGGEPQRIRFMKREGDNFPFNEGSYGGTNCQEILRVLIDRSEYLYKQKPCAETEMIIANLRSALLLFELRAARYHNRHLGLVSTDELMSGTCKQCGHIGCDHGTYMV